MCQDSTQIRHLTHDRLIIGTLTDFSQIQHIYLKPQQGGGLSNSYILYSEYYHLFWVYEWPLDDCLDFPELVEGLQELEAVSPLTSAVVYVYALYMPWYWLKYSLAFFQHLEAVLERDEVLEWVLETVSFSIRRPADEAEQILGDAEWQMGWSSCHPVSSVGLMPCCSHSAVIMSSSHPRHRHLFSFASDGNISLGFTQLNRWYL